MPARLYTVSEVRETYVVALDVARGGMALIAFKSVVESEIVIVNPLGLVETPPVS